MAPASRNEGQRRDQQDPRRGSGRAPLRAHRFDLRTRRRDRCHSQSVDDKLKSESLWRYRRHDRRRQRMGGRAEHARGELRELTPVPVSGTITFRRPAAQAAMGHGTSGAFTNRRPAVWGPRTASTNAADPARRLTSAGKLAALSDCNNACRRLGTGACDNVSQSMSLSPISLMLWSFRLYQLLL